MDDPELPGLRRVFDELEAEFEAGLRQQDEQEAVAALRAQVGETLLWEQLARRVGAQAVVRAGGAVLRGVLVASYSDFAVVRSPDSSQHLVPLGPATTIALPAGSPALQPAPAGVTRRYDLALALRELARRREPVRLELVGGGAITGTIETVGKDFVEVAEHDPGEARREAAVRARRFAPFAAVALVSLARDRS